MWSTRFVPLLLGFTLAACEAPLKQLETNASIAINHQTYDPFDLARHIFEVDGRGEGDTDAVSIAATEPNGQACGPFTREARDDPAIRLREQFACVLRNALDARARWKTEIKPDGKPRLSEGKLFKLVFYFNGGLNSREDALATAKSSYRQAERDNIYPIYMIWPTGAIRTYAEDVGEVRAGRWSPWTRPSNLATLPLRPVSDLARGVASTPAAWATSLGVFGRTSFGLGSPAFSVQQDEALLTGKGMPVLSKPGDYFIDADHNLYFDDTDDGSGTINADRINRDSRRGTSAKLALSYAYHAILAPLRLLSTPVMVGLGEADWRNMVRRTRTSVRTEAEFPKEDDPVIPILQAVDCSPPLQHDLRKLQHCYPRGSGGFARFFQWLESCVTGGSIVRGADGCPLEGLSPDDRETLRSLRITLIGHSMGAIVLNELLRLFPELPYENLIYMAGAASVRETTRSVTPILTKNAGCTKFYGLMLHPFDEVREPTAYGLLLSGSLLTYVDEYLDNPSTLPDRTVGQWRNLRMTRHLFPEEARKWMLFRIYDREAATYRDLNQRITHDPNPTEHGDFNDTNMPFWQENFWKPAQAHFHKPDTNDCDRLFAQQLPHSAT